MAMAIDEMDKAFVAVKRCDRFTLDAVKKLSIEGYRFQPVRSKPILVSGFSRRGNANCLKALPSGAKAHRDGCLQCTG
jgi:hypothetical protein